jgi:hypothetical protein
LKYHLDVGRISQAPLSHGKNLRNNADLAILRVDKGGATMVMNQEDYNTKMIEHLSQSGSYRIF